MWPRYGQNINLPTYITFASTKKQSKVKINEIMVVLVFRDKKNATIKLNLKNTAVIQTFILTIVFPVPFTALHPVFCIGKVNQNFTFKKYLRQNFIL